MNDSNKRTLNVSDLELADLEGIIDIIETGFNPYSIEGIDHFLDVVLCNKVYTAVMKDLRVEDVKNMMRKELEMKKEKVLRSMKIYRMSVIHSAQNHKIKFLEEKAPGLMDLVNRNRESLRMDNEFMTLLEQTLTGSPKEMMMSMIKSWKK